MSSIDETKKVAAVVVKEINQEALCFLVRKQNIAAIIGTITCKIGNCIKLLLKDCQSISIYNTFYFSTFMLSKICSAIKYLLRRKGKFLGRDENGNSYFESNQGKRWIKYRGDSEPTTVPPRWHIWLHYTDDIVPVNNKKRKIKHTSNLTGTKDAYYPNQKVKNYYKSWNPNN